MGTNDDVHVRNAKALQNQLNETQVKIAELKQILAMQQVAIAENNRLVMEAMQKIVLLEALSNGIGQGPTVKV